jgi:organic radical activating enzyme
MAMVPINQVILGGGDPLLGSSVVGNNLDEQLQLIEKYKQSLEAAKQIKQQMQPTTPIQQKLVWDDVDAEISPMSDEQKAMLFQDDDYVDTYTKIQNMVQSEILNLVKGRIESTPEGKELLQSQLKIVRRLKGKIIQETNREMEMFRKFREFSKTHPEVTYDEFIKANM